MKIISWNVNGIRSVLKKGFLDFVQRERPDVLCVQESRISKDDVMPEVAGYFAYWSYAERPGYAGTAIFSKKKPLTVSCGMGIKKHDAEGRVITAEYDKFYLVNVYVPNSKRDLSRLAYRQKEWDADFLKYLKGLERKKPVVFCGDLNVAHQPIDLTYPKANEKNHGFTPEERQGFENTLAAGFVDTFRMFEKSGGHYTWWSRMGNCRKRNIGWRIDYFLASRSLEKSIRRAWILSDVQGSDHCPVGVEIKNSA